MAFGLLLLLRVAQGAFAVIIVGLTGYVANWYNTDTLTPSPSQFNFLIFTPLFSLLSLAYIEATPRLLPKASHPYAHLTFELLNSLFYFAGFIAPAVFLAKLLFCNGSLCGAARADVVFAALSCVLWSASAAVLAMDFFRGGVRSLEQVKTDEAARNAMKEQRAAPTLPTRPPVDV